MKKLLKLLICACLCVISFGFTACGKASKINAPASDAEVYSNGGIVVQKGDYIYYANGYHSVDDITKKSQLNDKYKLGGLYSTTTSFEKDENGSLVYNKRLSSKLSSFEATDLQIFGNYMYYTTINTNETKNGNLQTKELQIYRVKLDRSDSEKVYSSNVDFEDSEGKRVVNFHYYEDEGKVYILIHENGTLKRVSCGKDISSASVIEKNVLSYVVENNKVYYTKLNEDDKYEVLAYDIKTDKVEHKIAMDKGDSISSLFALKFNNLYFYANFDGMGEYLYRMPLQNFESLASFNSAIKLTATTYTNVYLLESYSDGILAISSSKVEIIDAFNPLTKISIKSNLSATASIMKIENGYVYFKAEKEIKRWNYAEDTVETIYTEENTILDYAYDIVGDYIYYYATFNTNDYLYRVSISLPVEGKKSELVGQLEEVDIPEEEEEETEEE